jgi:hypothetical protein
MNCYVDLSVIAKLLLCLASPIALSLNQFAENITKAEALSAEIARILDLDSKAVK